MKEIPVEEANTQGAALLALAEAGEEIKVTRNGEVVVEIMPPRGVRQRARADRAFAEIRERVKAEGVRVDTETILEWIHEGHR